MAGDADSERVLPGGLIGYLDFYLQQKVGGDDVLSLQGWILGGDSRVRSVVLKRQRGPAIPIAYGLSRPDVAEAYPEHPSALMAGFAGQVTIPLTPIHRLLPEKIEICAIVDGGQEVCCFSRSFPIRKPRVETFVSAAVRRLIAAYRDGRLSSALFKRLRAKLESRKAAARERAARQMSPEKASADLKEALAGLQRVRLHSFLDSHSRLSWPPHGVPRVSIVLVLSNRAELTLQCLRSLQGLAVPVEIIIFDNASTDETSRLMDRLDGVKIVCRREKLAFALACNEAARMATADHILLLSNDAEILAGSLESALRTLEGGDGIGAVGAKLVSSDGRLQEAGGIIWKDGSCRAYGYGDAPRLPAYMYVRDVDYCSATFLLTPRELFLRMDGFDEACKLACEDVDYCVRLRKAGKRVVFDPGAVAVQFELPGPRLLAGHADWIAHKHAPGDRLLEARSASRPRQRILVLDDRVPHFRDGAGFPRTVELIRTLVEIGYFVTFYPVTMPIEDWSEVYDDIPRTVEVMTEWGSARLPDFLKERDGYYDQIIVSRPHNMKTFRSRFWVGGTWSTSARVIYDAEAVVSFREAEQRRLYGSQMTDAEVAQLLSDEMSLARGVHAVLSVTDRERDCFVSSGIGTAWTVGHIVPVNPTPRAFPERSGFLFVGAMGGIPNRDAVLWFGREIWPKIRSVVGGEASFAVVGGHAPAELRALPGVDVLGQVPDLTSLYNRSRIFVAPSRLAAGIPIKVQTAAAHGLPVVCTSILAEELGWDDGVELLVADDPEQFARCCVRLYSDEDLWQRLRKHALDRVARECSQQAFTVALAQALA